MTLDAFNQQLSNYWTSDKLKSAKSLDISLSKTNSKSQPINNAVLTGPESSIAGSLPTNNSTKSKIISPNGRQVYTTGRVFWQVGTTHYTCSAAVIVSKSGDMICTAGHCVYDTTSKTWYNQNNWVFVPGYNNGNTPYGIWPMRRVTALVGWTSQSDYNYDVAMVAVSTVNGQHLQAYVGSQGIGFNFPRSAFTYSFGYPSNINSGLTLQKCSDTSKNSAYIQNNYHGLGLACNMGPGCSGGPWLQNVVDSTGIGYVTSVNSFQITTVPNVINGPYFDTNIKNLYDNSTSM
ncbi:unnamed protein product [Adineta steineri]|uniref:Peptidase S1 domain-containing protein n=1 Tax=Adineta steineri TaxID=433720 RepID=A0A818I5P5_9BILA|nr:unnamed protein product [Adineta steineri]